MDKKEIENSLGVNEKNIGILTPPISRSGNIPLSNLVDILHTFSKKLYLITGNDGYTFFKENRKIHTYGIEHERGTNVFTRILRYIYTQLRISYKLARLSRKVYLWIFFFGEGLLLPLLTAKLLKKDVVLAFAASSVQMLKAHNDSLLKPVEILSKINCTLANRIVIYSENLIEEWNLEKYRNKISIAHHHFFDFDKLKIKNKFDEREDLVGYIGRLSEEKGVLNFVKSIPEVLKERSEIKFLVGGDGQLRDKIEEYLDVASLTDKVKLPGWVPREEFSTYLNELKLFVLPSYTEGLPYTILEAMACGTPVLATPVGAIPDVIKDEETGFIMENNSPECIAENIVRALAHPNLNEITKNAHALVEENYNYQDAVDGYRIILSSIFK